MGNLFKDIGRATDIPVSEIMATNIRTLKETDSVQKAVDMMSKHSISGLIVHDSSKTSIGIISEGDILKKVFHRKKDPGKVRVKEIMTARLQTVSSDLSIGDAAAIMKKHGISKLPVIDNNKIVGVVTKSDLLEKMNDLYYQNKKVMLLVILLTIQFIFIAVLLLAYINK